MRKLAVAVLVLGLVACSSGDDDESTTATEDTDETPAASDADASDSDADQAIADAAVLTLADFEPGWRSEDPDDDDDQPDMTDVCEGFDIDETAKADSKKFVRDDAEIENTIAIFETDAEAESFLAAFKSDETADCLTRFTEDGIRASAIKSGNEIDDIAVSLGQVSIEPYGDDTAAYQVEVTIETSGLSVDAYLDAVMVRSGRALALFSFVDIFSPLEEPRDVLIAAVVDRLDGQLAGA